MFSWTFVVGVLAWSPFGIGQVFGHRPELVELPALVMPLVSEAFALTCSLQSGTRPIRFEWLMNGRDLLADTDDRLVIDSRSTHSILTFERITRQHAGNYTCRASNSDGKDSSHTVLQVKGKRAQVVHCFS